MRRGAARYDLNRDGVIDSVDGDLLLAHHGVGLPALPAGHISTPTHAGGPGNPVGYTGHLFDPDPDLGLYLARHRWYSPAQGRWISRDPIGYLDGINLYQYVGSDPISHTDPLGLQGRKNPQLIDPRHSPSTGCGITVKENDGKTSGHRWIEISDPNRDNDPGGPVRGLGFWPRGNAFFGDGEYYSSNARFPTNLTPLHDPMFNQRGRHRYEWEVRPKHRIERRPTGEERWIGNTRSQKYEIIKAPTTLRYGNGAGKDSQTANCDEIRDCIDSHPANFKYSLTGVRGRHCRSAVDKILSDCGMEKAQKQIPKNDFTMQKIAVLIVVMLFATITIFITINIFESNHTRAERAVRDNNIWLLEDLLKSQLIDLDHTTRIWYSPAFKDWTLLMWACYHGSPESVALLLQHGADPNFQDYYRRAPLRILICESQNRYNFDQINRSLLALVAHGVDINNEPLSNDELLKCVEFYGNTEAVRILNFLFQ